MKNTKNRLEEIKKEGYELDFSTVFGNAFENYKKIALTVGIVFILIGIAFAIIGLIAFIVGSSFIDFNIDNLKNINPEDLQIANLALPYLFGYLIGGILFSAIVSPITAGIIKIAHNAATDQEISIGTAFEYYKKPYFKELFIATALISFFGLSLNLLFEMIDVKIVSVLISLIISLFTFLTIPFIIFGNLKAAEAIQASFTVVSKQIFVLIGLLICAYLFVMIGLIACCIGIIFTLPFVYSLYFCVYNEVIGVENENEMNEIES